MKYDLIIVGGGAAGLYAGAQLATYCDRESKEKKIDPKNIVIIDSSPELGKKLLLTGAGQCNLTQGGPIKDFVSHYGENGSKIRSLLYAHNNSDTMQFFESLGLRLFEREDGKVFPQSLSAKEVRNVLLARCKKNIEIQTNTKLIDIKILAENTGFELSLEKENKQIVMQTRFLLLSCGGASYPKTGSDGSIFPILKKMGLSVVKLKPALVPFFVDNYPFKELSGIAIEAVYIKKVGEKMAKKTFEPLLFTHDSFSGPAALHFSRYLDQGDKIFFDYLPACKEEEFLTEVQIKASGNSKQVASFFSQLPALKEVGLPKRFVEVICQRSSIDPTTKISAVSGKKLKDLVHLFKSDVFRVSGSKGWQLAMITAGGVSLEELDLKSLSSKKYPSLFFAGEILDIDGDSGGYNLQFAFASAKKATESIIASWEK